MSEIFLASEIDVRDEILCSLGHLRVKEVTTQSFNTTRIVANTIKLSGFVTHDDLTFKVLSTDKLDAIEDIMWVTRGGQIVYEKPKAEHPQSYGMGQPSHLACALPESWYLAHGVAKSPPEDPWVGIEDCPAEWFDGRVILGYDDSVSVSNGSHGLYPIFWAETLYGRREGLFWATDDIHQEPFYPTWVRPMIELPAGRRKTE